MAGRPTKYTEAIADEILNLIATTNKGLSAICKPDTMPDRTTFHRWMQQDEELRNKYARAKEDQADFLAEEILEIADDSSQDLERIDDFGNRIENREFVNRSKVKIDARKWLASKLKPKKYGDKIDVTTDGEKIQPFDLAGTINKFMDAGDKETTNSPK